MHNITLNIHPNSYPILTLNIRARLIKRELIDPNLVDDLMSSGVLSFWEKWGPLVEEYRKDFEMPQMSEYQEYLYNQIKTIAEKQHPKLVK